MPIYTYNCDLCGNFEVVQKMSEPPATKNPECKKEDCPCSAYRILSAPAVHFKGSGFYETDYKSKKKCDEKKDKKTD